jgi:hypothetical protein
VANPADIFFLPKTFADVAVAPIPWLADPIDPVTGQLLSIEQGFDPIDSAVIVAMRTERGSGSAVEDVGQRFRDAPRVDETLPQFLRMETQLALKHLTDAKDIAIRSVETTGEDDVGTVRLTYRSRNADDLKPLNSAPSGLRGSGV